MKNSGRSTNPGATEEDYAAPMKEGDDLKNIKDHTAAIDRSTKALALKPLRDSAATQKIQRH
ncbi:MAG: hypothetical protein IPM74_19760 [Crocinitomicaceae bacterium]|nr:hypothetical protein [Crocinitomicaceae bacterium]